MINVAICDSSYEVMDELERIICEVADDKITFVKFNNPFALSSYVLDSIRTKINAIFINTEINGKSGVEIIKEILENRKGIEVVFFSEEQENITEIFQTNPCFFLKIPFNKTHVREAVNKLQKNISSKNTRRTINFISGRGGSNFFSIDTSEIIYIESEKRKVHIFTDTGKYSFYSKLGDVESRMGNDFVRVHQSYIVNITKIKNMNNRYITMHKVDRQIPISRARLENVERVVWRNAKE